MTSEASQKRQEAYDRCVRALGLINPNAVPVAGLGEVCAIPLVAEQARQAVAPVRAGSPEHMLHSRVSNMQGAVATLVAEAKRKGIPAELPPSTEGDLGARLQMLVSMHEALESKIAYFNTTTKEQRAIDALKTDVRHINKQLTAIGVSMAALRELLPLLMQDKSRGARK